MGGPGSGREKMEFDESILFDMLEEGHSKKDIAEQLDVSLPTLNRFISEMQEKSPVLLQYRSIQSLHLTQLQHQILQAITPEKINNSSLKDLVLAYKILKEKEQVIEGNPTEVKGIVAYLVELEKRDAALASTVQGEILGDLEGRLLSEECESIPVEFKVVEGKSPKTEGVARSDNSDAHTPSGRPIPKFD